MVAMSPRRKVAAPARSSSASRSLTVFNAPLTRSCTLSLGVTSTPLASTVFCAAIWLTMASNGKPSWANFLCESTMLIFSSCTPNGSTLATSGTRSSCWRTRSA